MMLVILVLLEAMGIGGALRSTMQQLLGIVIFIIPIILQPRVSMQKSLGFQLGV
jgi:hypothetical protein